MQQATGGGVMGDVMRWWKIGRSHSAVSSCSLDRCSDEQLIDGLVALAEVLKALSSKETRGYNSSGSRK